MTELYTYHESVRLPAFKCTTTKERLISRWEHEHVLEAVHRRLDEHPEKMRQRRETVEHHFGTMKARMGATHFLMKTRPKVATEMALHVLAYNMTRMMSIMGVQPPHGGNQRIVSSAGHFDTTNTHRDILAGSFAVLHNAIDSMSCRRGYTGRWLRHF